MRSSIEVRSVNAFVKDGSGGNPAGVVLDADALSAAQKQDIARRVGLPETAFVSRSALASVKLEFFTPTRQIAHCGHATIATFALLRQLGRLQGSEASKETIDGLRRIHLEGEQAFMTQTAPVVETLPPDATLSAAGLARTLGMADETLVQAGDPPCLLSTGNRFLLIDVGSPQALALANPDQPAIARISEALDLIGLYAYARTPGAVPQATTRMFAPRYGIDEEAGTGMAAGPLACRLWMQGHVRDTDFELEQGRYMAQPSVSRLLVRLQLGAQGIESLAIGGAALSMSSLMMSV